MPHSPADWQLPPGVNRGLWDYVHDASVARDYDAQLVDTPLLRQDLLFAERHFPRPGAVIDLGCGTGRLLIPFARRGYRVLGVDLSAAMLRVAAGKAAAAAVPVHLLRANLVELDAVGASSFDYAACLFSTLGMVRGAANRRAVVGHAFRLLRPGGVFVLHAHNRWFNAWDPSGRRWLLGECWRGLTGRETGDRPMAGRHGDHALALHHFTRREVVRLLTQVGFRVVEVTPVGIGGEEGHGWSFGLGWLWAYGYLVAARRS